MSSASASFRASQRARLNAARRCGAAAISNAEALRSSAGLSFAPGRAVSERGRVYSREIKPGMFPGPGRVLHGDSKGAAVTNPLDTERRAFLKLLGVGGVVYASGLLGGDL